MFIPILMIMDLLLVVLEIIASIHTQMTMGLQQVVLATIVFILIPMIMDSQMDLLEIVVLIYILMITGSQQVVL